ncbi:MAG: hypothetical protein JO317_06085 [Verrucomicrobiae bacterium]|nr:hypothetical protein [Verrucomicrobiae bacterium]
MSATNRLTRYFTSHDQDVYAILNWQGYKGPDHAVALRKLTPEQADAYRAQRREGRTEQEIFASLFPRRPAKPVRLLPPKISVEIDLLHRSQLLELLRRRLGERLPTLDRLSTPDLRALLAKLG